MPRLVIDFDLSIPREARAYSYLSEYPKGKKAIVIQALNFLEGTLAGNQPAPVTYPVLPSSFAETERPVKEKKEKAMKEKSEVVITEPVIEKVKEEPVVQAPVTPAVNPVPEPTPTPVYQQQVQEQYQAPANNPVPVSPEPQTAASDVTDEEAEMMSQIYNSFLAMQN